MNGTLLLLLLCLAGGAFFAGMETGVISLNRLRLRHLVQHQVRGAAILENFLRRPDRLLGTTLVGTNLCHVIIAVLATSMAEHLHWAPAVTLAGALTTLVILVFSEYLPKAWFQSFPSHRTLPFARALEISARILFPLRWGIAKFVMTLIGSRATRQEQQPFITREEFLHLASEGSRSGVLTPEENRMIQRVFELSGIQCRDIMVPRERMVWVRHDQPAEELLALARQKDVNRFPVWDEARGKFVGVVHIFDVLADESPAGKTAQSYMRHPQFVAEHTLVDHVMPRMRVTKQPLVLVTNEKFEVIGLIAMDDVLDVIVGGARPAPAAGAGPGKPA